MLKQSVDGLSKVWKPCKTNDPFNTGDSICFTNEGSNCVSLYNGNIVIMNWKENQRDSSLLFEDTEDGSEEVTCFCVNSTGTEVVTASRNLLIRHWKISENVKSCARSIKGHNMPILAIDFDKTDTLVATGSADKTVRVWDITRGYCTHVFRNHSNIVQLVKFHPDQSRMQLFSCGEDNTVKVYNLLDSACVASFNDHLSTPTSLSTSPDGQFLTTVGRDKVINFYDLRKLMHLKTIAVMDELESVVVLTQSHAQRFLLNTSTSRANNDSIKINNPNILVAAGQKGVVRIFLFGTQINGGFAVESLYQVSLATGIIMNESNLYQNLHIDDSSEQTVDHLRSVSSLHYIPSKEELIIVTNDHTIATYKVGTHISNIDSGLPLELANQIVGSSGDILDVILVANDKSNTDKELNPEDYKLAVVTNSSNVQIMDHQFNCDTLYGHTDIVLAADVSPDGLFMVTSSKDKTCRVWSLKTFSCCGIAKGHTDAIGAVCMSQRDATYASKQPIMISGSGDKVLKRWALASVLYRESKTQGPQSISSSHSVRAHDKDINTIAMSPNDAIVASGSQDSTIRIWRTQDLEQVATLTGHRKGVWRVCFSPVDKVLASCSGDRTVRLWSLGDYSCLRTFQGHTASVLALKFVNHGMQLISGSSDGLVRLWTIRTGECENTFDVHKDKIWAIAAPRDGSFFYSAGSDSRIVRWEDATITEENTKLQESERVLLLEQQLSNDIRNKRYDKALEIALGLKHSNKVLGLFTRILEDSVIQSSAVSDGHFCQCTVVDTMVCGWDDEKIATVMSYLRDWNTNAKHTYVAQLILDSIIRNVKVERLMKIRFTNEAVSGLQSYSERHFGRLDRLHEALYLLEYISGQKALQPVVVEDNESTQPGKVASSFPMLFAPTTRKRKGSFAE